MTLRVPRGSAIRPQRYRTHDWVHRPVETCCICQSPSSRETSDGNIRVSFVKSVSGTQQSRSGGRDVVDQDELGRQVEVLPDRQRLIVLQGGRPPCRQTARRFGNRLGSLEKRSDAPPESSRHEIHR
jgi:hypothetical protein